MSGQKGFLSKITTVAIIIIVLIIGYFFYQKFSHRQINIYRAVPESSAIFVRFNSPKALWDNNKADNKIWNNLQKIPKFTSIHSSIDAWDSILSTYNLKNYLDKQELIISYHPEETADNSLLFIVSLPENKGDRFVQELSKKKIGGSFSNLEKKYKQAKFNKLVFNGSEKVFNYALYKGLLIASFNTALVEQSIDRIVSRTSVLDNPLFQTIKQTEGKRVDANIYINQLHLSSILSDVSNPAFTQQPVLNAFADWTELDVLVKSDELLLNGYTIAADSLPRYLNAFQDQEAQKTMTTHIIPYYTTALISFGMSDPIKYYHNLKSYSEISDGYTIDTYSQSVYSKFGIHLEHDLYAWVGNEISFVSCARNSSEINDKSFIVIHTNNPTKAKQKLNRIRSASKSTYSKTIKGHEVRRIAISDFFEGALGPLFSVFTKNYYTLIDDNVIIANNVGEIEKFINTYNSNKTLDLNENYKSFSDNISESSNIYVYSSIRNGLDLIRYLSNEELSKTLGLYSTAIKSFQAIAIQMSNVNNMYYTNAYLKYTDAYKEEDLAMWKAEMDAEIYGKPFFIKDHTDNTYNIIVFDIENQMYLIDDEGIIRWKKRLAEPVRSNVFAVEYFKNGKIQYLFNSDNYIHLIDLLGRDVENYPIKVSRSITSPISVFDYNQNKNYRIFFATDDKRINNYDINGKAVSGWNKPRTDEIVNNRIQHLVANNRDYIISYDQEGNVKITDRRGRDRINIKKPFVKAKNSEFYVNKTNNKGIIMTTDENGHLTYISSRGKIDETIFGEFSADHFFLYDDINKDGYNDFIYLDRNKLTVFDRFKKVIFSHTFEHDIHFKPEIIRLSMNEKLLGIVSDKSSEIFLFDKNGKAFITTGLVGDTPFAIGSLKNNRDLNLVVGTGNYVYCYMLK